MSYKKELCMPLLNNYQLNKNNLNNKQHDQLFSTISESDLTSSRTQKSYESRTVNEMELMEVEKLLQKMEATDLKISKRCASTTVPQDCETNNQVNNCKDQLDTGVTTPYSSQRKLMFEDIDKKSENTDKTKYDITLPDTSYSFVDVFPLDESDKIIKEFKTWEPGTPVPKISGSFIRTDVKSCNGYSENEILHSSTVKPKESVREMNHNTDSLFTTNLQDNSKELQPFGYIASSTGNCSNYNGLHKLPSHKIGINVSTNTEPFVRKGQTVLSLSDFWETNSNKPQEEQLMIKLDEEKFRREHCESLIHELQKKLLEQQEKVAVAIRVDNEKNVLISQFHSAWVKLKQRVQSLETDYESLQGFSKNITEKHQSEINEFQVQIKRNEAELSKALDLAAGYKEKSDGLIKEKVDLLQSHANELESYKSLVQEAEKRYDQLKDNYSNLLEKHHESEEALKNVQQELNKERLKGGEVRNEMSVIHKALDTCEAELTVLRQEKESLQLKLKEEMDRNNLLNENKSSLLNLIDEAKKAEKVARNEVKTLAEQNDKIKTDLQELYQKQVDVVVKGKLQEFQTQLDAAESEFVSELENRQRVIAECAARKIKDVIDKHQLEINLLEEKHREEKRLHEIQLAQALQKSNLLESQLNTQRATKSQLAEQLHSVMQQQWQQALKIISSTVPDGGVESSSPFQRLYTDKMIGSSQSSRKRDSLPSSYAKSQSTIKWQSELLDRQKIVDSQKRENHNESAFTVTSADETPLTEQKESKDDLRKYIKMIAEMQEQSENLQKYKNSISSPPPVIREVPRKHYVKKEENLMSEESMLWGHPVSETDMHDIIEYLPISQKHSIRCEKQKMKRPWK
ncbi:uncharacterized protein [Prorops nasuta]